MGREVSPRPELSFIKSVLVDVCDSESPQTSSIIVMSQLIRKGGMWPQLKPRESELHRNQTAK